MQKETIYVIGHKNPDTDSICSAMAYAHLRQRQGLSSIQAARAGSINHQTQFVLEELALPTPPLLIDVFPRVRHVIGEHVITIAGDAPLSRAMELFHLHNVRMLPVIDEERRPQGLLFLKRVAERFVVPSQEMEIRRVLACPDSIRQCLRGSFLHKVKEKETEELNLYVGAMDSKTFCRKMEGLDPRRMVLITGDRVNVQRKAVDSGVRILIVTGGLPVSPEIVARGKENEVTIISTPYDTATSTWLTRLATPVRCLVDGGTFGAAGLDERMDDLRVKLLHAKDPGVVVLDGEGRVAGVATKSNLLRSSPVKLILVDHNELSQAVAGADKVEILEVVDHHRLGNFHTDTPIRFINQPLGSTCTVIATLYRQGGVVPEPAIAGLMLAGLLSDTVMLKSPTTTDVDREIAAWLGELSGLDPLDFGRRIFAAGSTLADYPSVRQLLLADFKEYRAGESSFGIGQVEVVSFHEFLAMKEEISSALLALRQERGLEMAGLLVTDIVQETSLLLALGGRELSYLIEYPRVDENLYELKGVLSRKKQLVPHLLKILKG
jgi:manganese-dependent inorganic pyrophosphatase